MKYIRLYQKRDENSKYQKIESNFDNCYSVFDPCQSTVGVYVIKNSTKVARVNCGNIEIIKDEPFSCERIYKKGFCCGWLFDDILILFNPVSGMITINEEKVGFISQGGDFIDWLKQSFRERKFLPLGGYYMEINFQDEKLLDLTAMCILSNEYSKLIS